MRGGAAHHPGPRPAAHGARAAAGGDRGWDVYTRVLHSFKAAPREMITRGFIFRTLYSSYTTHENIYEFEYTIASLMAIHTHE